MDIRWIEVFTTGLFSGFYIIIAWDSLDSIQGFPRSSPWSYYPNTYYPVLSSTAFPKHTVYVHIWILIAKHQDRKSIMICFLPIKYLLFCRSSLPRKHSACNGVGVTYMCTLQVVEVNWAELKYIEENCGNKCTLCFNLGITSKSD